MTGTFSRLRWLAVTLAVLGCAAAVAIFMAWRMVEQPREWDTARPPTTAPSVDPPLTAATITAAVSPVTNTRPDLHPQRPRSRQPGLQPWHPHPSDEPHTRFGQVCGGVTCRR